MCERSGNYSVLQSDILVNLSFYIHIYIRTLKYCEVINYMELQYIIVK